MSFSDIVIWVLTNTYTAHKKPPALILCLSKYAEEAGAVCLVDSISNR